MKVTNVYYTVHELEMKFHLLTIILACVGPIFHCTTLLSAGHAGNYTPTVEL